MKLKIFLIISAVASAVYGLTILFVPDFVMHSNGLVVSESAKVFARSVAGLFMGIAAINYFAKNGQDSQTLKGILIGNIIVHAMALITDGMAVSKNVISQNSWFSILVHIIFLLAFVYYFYRIKKIS